MKQMRGVAWVRDLGLGGSEGNGKNMCWNEACGTGVVLLGITEMKFRAGRTWK